MKTARLVFEDGTVFYGTAFAGEGERLAELVFNTAMSGYQEVLTDPSYCGQMVLMTYPLIGSYGINSEDVESSRIHLDALLVREYIDFPSNWRSEQTLKSYLEAHNVLGIENLDTRAITRYLRDYGALKAIVTTNDDPIDELIAKVKAFQGMVGRNLVDQVTCQEPYVWPAEGDVKFRIGVIDCGIKHNILRCFAAVGCEAHVFPATVTSETLLNGGFDGLFVSNGPGDPEPVTTVIETLKDCIGKLPIFGICLGQQLLALALGGKTYKLKFGHHGANHPVQQLSNGQVEVSSQNHGFCVDQSSLNEDDFEVTHMNLNDQTVAGFKHKTLPLFSVQYHPESAPGPHDSRYLFDEFCQMMEASKV